MRKLFITLAVATGLIAPAGAALPAPAGARTSAIPASAPCGVAGAIAPAAWDHVALLIFENRSFKQIIGDNTNAPYLNSLARACSYSTNMKQVASVSLPNYVALTSGYTGCDQADVNGKCTHEKPITSNRNPSTWPQAQASLFELLGAQAQEVEEKEPSNCYLKGSGDFIINHTPFQFFTRVRSLCNQYAVPFFASSATPNPLAKKFNLITPGRVGIMHSGYPSTLNSRTKAGDDWAKLVIPQLINSPEYQAGKTAIIITWDEGSISSDQVPWIVISPSTTAGGTSGVAYNHYSTLKGIQQMLGVGSTLLGHAGDAGVASVREDPVFKLR